MWVTCQADDLRLEPALARFQNAPFDVGETGEIESGQFLESALDGVEARFELARAGAERMGALVDLPGLRGARIPEQGLARERVGGHAIRGDERCPTPRNSCAKRPGNL